MKKIRKFFVAALTLALATALGLSAAACGGNKGNNDNPNIDYTITVELAQQSVNPNIRSFFIIKTTVKLLDENEKTVASGTIPSDRDTTVTSKTITISAPKGTYTVVLDNALFSQGLGYEQDKKVSTDSPNATIKIDDQSAFEPNENVVYTITAKIDGSPAVGFTFQLCGVTDGQCHPMDPTGDDGKASLELPAGEYEVHINGWADGYDKDKYNFDDTKYKVTKDNPSIEVEFDVATKEKVMYSNGTPAKGVSVSLIGTSDGATQALPFTGTTNDEGNAVIFAPRGVYTVTATLEGYRHVHTAIDSTDPTAGTPSVTITLWKEGTNILFGIGAVTDKDITVDTTDGIDTCGGKLLGEGETANGKGKFYSFNPGGRSGQYKVTVTGNDGGAISRFAGINVTTPVETVEGNELNFTITDSEMTGEGASGNSYIFLFSSAGSAGKTFTVKFERTGDAPLEVKPENKEMHAAATAKYQDVAPMDYEFEFLPMTADVQKCDDGKYRVGGTGGDLVLVALDKIYNAETGLDKSLCEAAADTEHNTSFGGVLYTEDDGKSYSHNYVPFLAEYRTLCNAEGLYPLNDELKTFLQHFAESGGYDRFLEGAAGDNLYLFSCGTYVPKYKTLQDGDGSNESTPYVIPEIGEYKVSLGLTPTYFKAGFALTISASDADLTMSLDGSQHPFATENNVDVKADVVFALHAKSEKDVVFTVKPVRGAKENPFPLALDNNTINVSDGPVYYSYKNTSQAQLLKFTVSGDGEVVLTRGGITLGDGQSAFVELQPGATCPVEARNGNYKLNIEQNTSFSSTSYGRGTDTDPFQIENLGTFRATLNTQNDGTQTVAAYYSYNSAEGGKYRLTFFCAEVMATVDRGDGQPATLTLDEDEAAKAYTFDMQADQTVKLGFISQNNTQITCFFIFEKVTDPAPGPTPGPTPGEGSAKTITGEHPGDDPYRVDDIIGDYSVKVPYIDFLLNVYLSFTPAEDITITLSSSDPNASIMIGTEYDGDNDIISDPLIAVGNGESTSSATLSANTTYLIRVTTSIVEESNEAITVTFSIARAAA